MAKYGELYAQISGALVCHPKTKQAARLLKISRVTLLGHLSLLWNWALVYAPDGNLSSCKRRDITDAVLWTDDDDYSEAEDARSEFFLRALIECGQPGAGFLDEAAGNLRIHDWQDYGGKMIDQRNKARDKTANARSSGTVTEIDSHSSGTVTEIDSHSSGQSRAEQNRTEDEAKSRQAEQSRTPRASDSRQAGSVLSASIASDSVSVLSVGEALSVAEWTDLQTGRLKLTNAEIQWGIERARNSETIVRDLKGWIAAAVKAERAKQRVTMPPNRPDVLQRVDPPSSTPERAAAALNAHLPDDLKRGRRREPERERSAAEEARRADLNRQYEQIKAGKEPGTVRCPPDTEARLNALGITIDPTPADTDGLAPAGGTGGPPG